ncbi:ATPase, T2SS/T4P/T4SS family [Paenibacillus sp. GCM10027627]|uniref:ATPase, T2SS/T4P/T4SS family n=1 Tax=unclassified Paenibacillus TaxID=185978 RepID=UPI00362CE8B0
MENGLKIADYEADWVHLGESGKVNPEKWKQWQTQLLSEVLKDQDRRRSENRGGTVDFTETEYRHYLYEIIQTIEEVPSIHYNDLIKQYLDNAFRYGPVQPLWERPRVSDIQIFIPYDDRHEQIISYVENRKRKIFKDQRFRSFEQATDWINHHLSRINLRYDPAKIYLDGTFPNFERIHIISGTSGYSTFDPIQRTYTFVRCLIISIRRFLHPFSWHELTDENEGKHTIPLVDQSSLMARVDLKKIKRLPVYTSFSGKGAVADQATMDYLEISQKLEKNLMYSGGTGTGKTTIANANLAAIPPGTLLLILEESPEMQPQIEGHVIRLYERPGVFGLEDGLKSALRMYPDIVFLSEIRDKIAYVYVQTISSGHDGSSSTIHASSCKAVKNRIADLAASHPSRPDRDQILKILHERLHVIIHLNAELEDRFMDEVCEMIPETGELHTVSRFVKQGVDRFTKKPVGYFEFMGPTDRFVEEMMNNGIEIPKSWKWEKK